MLMVNNPFGQDYADFNEKTEADRIGQRIREIRTAKGMSQAALEKEVGLGAARIQKYENGSRKPKKDLLKQIAKALGVETIALMDPVVSNYIGATYALFEMEKRYNLKPKYIDGQLVLVFDDLPTSSMNEHIKEWENERQIIEAKLEKAETKEEKNEILKEYNFWKWSYPKAIVDRTEQGLNDIRKAEIESQINKLQEELSKLNSNNKK